MAWPPVLPDEISGVDKDMVKDTIKKSLSNFQYLTTIQDEGSKIDINDLASKSQALRDITRTLLLNIFQAQIDAQPEWRDYLENKTPDEIINNIADWMTEGDQSLNGGTKSSQYQNFPKEDNEKLPPGRPFRTLEELHMVAGMNDAIYNLLASRITVYGIKGINVNHASKEVLMSLDPSITKEIAAEIIKRREDQNLGGPYKDEQDFTNYVSTLGARISATGDKKIPLLFDAVYNFRIRSTGTYGRSTSDIIAVVYDFDKVKSRLASFMSSDNNANIPAECQSKTGDEKEKCICEKKTNATEKKQCLNNLEQKKNQQTSSGSQNSKGRPRIVYWYEN